MSDAVKQEPQNEEEEEEEFVEEGDDNEDEGNEIKGDENDDDGEGGAEENDDEQENDNDDNNEGKDHSNSIYIRMRGLPWSVTNEEILDFLKGVNVVDDEKGVYIVKNKSDGKNTGEAFVELESEADEEAAFKHDRENMGHRYIEIFKATAEEAEFAMKRSKKTGKVVKLRGLPYSVDEDMIEDFFDGLDIRKDREGIVIVMDRRGRATGEAYVQFKTELDGQKALDRNREKIGHRYIEIFRSSLSDLKRALGTRPAPYDRFGGRGGRNSVGGRSSGPIRNNRRGDGFGSNFGGGGGGSFNGNGFNGGGFGNFGNNNFGMGRSNMGGGGGGFGNNFNGGGGGGSFDGNNFGNNGVYCIHMRGLPYYSYENDINDFFAPLRPLNIEIIYNKRGLHSGTANVFFSTADDAIQAMRKHKEQMGARYIELFYDGNTQKVGRI